MDALIQVSILWLLTGVLLWFLDGFVHYSLKHLFAFAVMVILFCGLALIRPASYEQPFVLLVLGLSISSQQISTYFSGTPRHSGRIYACLLFGAALLAQWQNLPLLEGPVYGGILLLTGLSVVLMVIEKLVEHLRPWFEPLDLILWGFALILYAVAATFDLSPALWVLPWILVMVFTQIRHWGLKHIPAPLYGLMAIFMTILVGTAVGHLQEGLIAHSLVQRLPILGLALALLIVTFWSPYLPAAFSALYFAQELLLNYGLIHTMETPVAQHLMFWRLIFFLTVTGLFVMAETQEFESLNRGRIQGIGRFRPRIAYSMIFYILVLAGEPFILVGTHSSTGWWLLLIHAAAGVILGLRWLVPMMWKSDRDSHYLRPSLSTWVLVVLIMFIVIAFIIERIIESNWLSQLL